MDIAGDYSLCRALHAVGAAHETALSVSGCCVWKLNKIVSGWAFALLISRRGATPTEGAPLRLNNGTGIAVKTGVKKNTLILKPRQKLSLGDLILAVSSCTRNTKETVATVADLLGSGKVRVQSDGRFLRAKVC